MSDILIRGMKMPEACCACPYAKHSKCTISKHRPTFSEWYEEKPSWCPLVPIPEHGRLIDADKLRELYEPWENDVEYGIDIDKCNVPCPVIRLNIDNMPTIIPAEPPKEET